MLATRQVWFPLRSNISHFETTAPRLTIEGRIKEMAILADELLFEPGAYMMSVGEGGVSAFWTPPGHLTEAQIRERRQAVKQGSSFYVAMAPEPYPGGPADMSQARTVLSGSLEHSYFAEYEVLLNDLGLIDLPWIRGAQPTLEAVEVAAQVQGEMNRAEQWDRSAPRLSANRFLDGQTKKDLNRDLAYGAVMRVPVVADEMHGPMLTYKASHNGDAARTPEGSRALNLWVPDFSRVPWPDIIALHDHDAIGAFRAKLIQAEEDAAHLPEPDRSLYIKELGLDALARRVAELRQTATRAAADVGSALGFDALSAVLPFGGSIAAGARAAARLRAETTEWTAILLRLRGASKR